MGDIIVAVGLVLVIEGLIWALAPDQGRRLLAIASSAPNEALKQAGWAAVIAGAVIVWLVRG
ncbi:MAG: DUF2065 domain-containing protein [Hyphomicrobiaceae bacterium]|nr:DUF2065 domain-containing protein [Hyphomicrobiaceae bacterium]MCC0011332.1 DUF2065 domain-containing protein [Hyphomicrobiaceae bacterium]